MPVCPKCHKLISAKKWERHQRRCGTSHKRKAPLQEHSFSEFWMKL